MHYTGFGIIIALTFQPS